MKARTQTEVERGRDELLRQVRIRQSALGISLRYLSNDIAREPLPADMLSLLEQLGGQAKKRPSPKKR